MAQQEQPVEPEASNEEPPELVFEFLVVFRLNVLDQPRFHQQRIHFAFAVDVVDVGVAVIVVIIIVVFVVRPAPVGGEGVWDEPEGAGVAAGAADGLVLGGHGARVAPRAAALHADAELLAAVGLG